MTYVESLNEIVRLVEYHIISTDFNAGVLYSNIGEPKAGAHDYFLQFSLEKNLNKNQQLMLAAALVPYTHPPSFILWLCIRHNIQKIL